MAINDVIANYVDRMITKSANLFPFSPYIYAAPPTQLAWNASALTAPIDLTCLVAMNSYEYSKHGGILITRKHILVAYHFGYGIGTTVYFLGNDGIIVSRTITHTASYTVGSVDLQVAQLDSDVPITITPASVLPTNFAQYISNGGTGIPVISIINRVQGEGRVKQINIAEIKSSSLPNNYTIIGQSANSLRNPYYSTPNAQDQDSGNPTMMVLPGLTIALFAFHYPTNGPALHYFRTTVQGFLDAWGGGYTLTSANLAPYEGQISGFHFGST